MLGHCGLELPQADSGGEGFGVGFFFGYCVITFDIADKKVQKMTLEHKKYEIIQEIMSITQEDIINSIEKVVKTIIKPRYRLDLGRHANIKGNVDIEKIMAEKPLVDFDMDEFIEEADRLDWDKSTNELLAELD
ncbi:MAG: hypothetical protein R3B47_07900 [Bacteroidia bacterium]